VLINYNYRLLKGASWGIAIKVVGEVLPGAVVPPGASKISEEVWLQVDVGWQPSEEEVGFLQQGLHLVTKELERSCSGRTPILVRLTGLQYNPTDYQPEGLAVAIAEWAAQACGFSKPEVPVVFDRTRRRYVFAFSGAETNRASALGEGTQMDNTALPGTHFTDRPKSG
jgi:hypothetical protein